MPRGVSLQLSLSLTLWLPCCSWELRLSNSGSCWAPPGFPSFSTAWKLDAGSQLSQLWGSPLLFPASLDHVFYRLIFSMLGTTVSYMLSVSFVVVSGERVNLLQPVLPLPLFSSWLTCSRMQTSAVPYSVPHSDLFLLHFVVALFNFLL